MKLHEKIIKTSSIVQLAFSFVVYPCLVLQYMGQAAFISKNFSTVSLSFYSSIPGKFSIIKLLFIMNVFLFLPYLHLYAFLSLYDLSVLNVI